MKSLSILLVTIASAACGARERTPEQPASPTTLAPPPSSPAPPPPAQLHAHSAPLGAWLDPGAPSAVPVREAVAVLAPTQGSQVAGVVRFRAEGESVEVTAWVGGLPGSVHAYHVHVYGDCSSPDAESAGPHFHFTGSSFDRGIEIITGNLGELRPGDTQVAEHRARVPATLQGRYSIIGRSVVVHERGNDPTSPPDGAAGKRLACGVIGIAGPLPTPRATAHR